MKFHYKAQGKTGVLLEETIDAENREAVIAKLRETGATPIVVEEVKKRGIEISVPFIDNLLSSVSLKDKVMFAKNLARMLDAGLPMSRALEVFRKQSKKGPFLFMIEGLIKEINSGGTLSSGMQKHTKIFSPLFIGMVHAGEESGAISDNLVEISTQLEKSYKLKKKVKGAMIYPGVILSAMILIGILMFIFVVPTLLETFENFDLDLPATTRAIIAVNDFVQAQTVLFLGIIVAVVGGGIGFLKWKAAQKYIDWAILKLPAIGIIAKEMNSALAMRTLSALLGSGLSVQEALDITKNVLQNVYYQETFTATSERIQQGGRLSEVFQERTDLYPVMLGEMIEVGEETGKLSEMLKDVASFYEDEVDNKTKNLSTIIEPVLMIIIGAAVGFFAISMMSPMYSLLDSVN